MVILKADKWVVMDTKTREVISEHPFTSDYEKKKAKESAIASNQAWKSQQ
jgi:hypothetical protein